ncbi:hypothetical protein L6232_23260, partial [Shewanella sp. C31]|nr:hypothetical protein [Shewanella electrica]
RVRWSNFRAAVHPVHHQDLSQVRLGKELKEGFLEPLGGQAVEGEGEDGVARGLAQAQVGQEVRVGPGKTFHAAQGVHAAEEGHQDER